VVSNRKHLYALVESIVRYTNTINSVISGVFDSPSGRITGPWNKIADSQKLAASGSALKLYVGYKPGVQGWYNQFLDVDPSDSAHVIVGLEEVFETRNAGVSWSVIILELRSFMLVDFRFAEHMPTNDSPGSTFHSHFRRNALRGQ
jgi:hypothetical protein